MSVWRFIVILTAVSGFVLAGCGKQPALTEQVQALTLNTLTGEQIVLSELESPLLINFWATDCVICIREMPHLAKLYQHYAPAGFVLVAVAMPYDPPNRVLDMAQRERWPFPVALDLSGKALDAFATVKGTPTSYLLDGHGKLVERYVGAIPTDKLKKHLDSLLDLT